jgi:hypothetical protein
MTSEYHKTLKFTPPPAQGRYALFVGESDDNGTLRVYNDLGHAKNAVHHTYRAKVAKILERVGDAWYVLYEVPEGATGYGSDKSSLPWYKELYWTYGERKKKVAKPMTREEYAEWRLKVAEEQRAEKSLYSFTLG